jgi:hypothetical protein
MRQALAIDEATIGTDHPTVAVRLDNLAWLLNETNRLEEAEPLMRRALEIDEASFDARPWQDRSSEALPGPERRRWPV